MEYKEVEAILAELHLIRPKDKPAFRSRLRVLRDIGVPSVPKPGKGSRVNYQFADLWEAHFGLKLQSFGLPPLRVMFLTTSALGWLRLLREQEKEKGADIWAYLSLSTRQDKAVDDDWMASRTMVDTLDQIFLTIRRAESERHPSMLTGLLNLSQLTRECETAMTKRSK